MMYQCNLKTCIPGAYPLHFNFVSVSVIALILSDPLSLRIKNVFIEQP